MSGSIFPLVKQHEPHCHRWYFSKTRPRVSLYYNRPFAERETRVVMSRPKCADLECGSESRQLQRSSREALNSRVVRRIFEESFEERGKQIHNIFAKRSPFFRRSISRLTRRYDRAASAQRPICSKGDDTHVVVVILVGVMLVGVQIVVQRRVDVQRRGGHRVHRQRHGRQHFVFGRTHVTVQIAVIAVGQTAVVAVVAAQHDGVSARERGAEK